MVKFGRPLNIPDLEWDLVLQVENQYSIFNGNNSRGELVYSAVVSRERNVDFVDFKNRCNSLHLICPVEKLSYEVNGMQIMALLYQPFKTLNIHLSSSNVGSPTFVNVLKGIIQGLNNMHMYRVVPETIDENTLVVKEDNQGSLLLIDAAVEQNGLRSDLDCQADFALLYGVIENYLNIYLNQNPYPVGLGTVLDCMVLASTSARRQRLLRAPYFCSDWELVNGFIIRVFKGSETCEEFKNALIDATITDTTPRISSHRYKEVQLVWEKNKTTLNNRFVAVYFLRNCIEHINERWKDNVTLVEKEATVTAYNQGTLPNYIPDASLMMLHPKLFLDEVVERIELNLLHTIFYQSYNITAGWIAILDD